MKVEENYILISLKNGGITNVQLFKDRDKAIKVANQHEFNPEDGFVNKMFSVIK